MALARASEPFTNWRTRRQLARAAHKFEGIHQKRLRAEALFLDLVEQTPAAEMLTSPVLRRQRDLIAALSIEDFVAKAALEARARSIRMDAVEQLRKGTAVAQGNSLSADEPAFIQPTQWLHLEPDQSLQNARDAVDGKMVHSELTITRRN
jgi:hypothetical protein